MDAVTRGEVLRELRVPAMMPPAANVGRQLGVSEASLLLVEEEVREAQDDGDLSIST